MTDEDGKNIHTRAYKPQDIYRQVNNIAPDLVTILGNLDWRSSSTVGTGKIHMYENDTGPDDANHAQEGMIIARLPKGMEVIQRDPWMIYDVAPSILRYFGIDPPPDFIGQSFVK
jgi:predicted AlkP superfamily phosphohydrolase/phosphomutase